MKACVYMSSSHGIRDVRMHESMHAVLVDFHMHVRIETAIILIK